MPKGFRSLFEILNSDPSLEKVRQAIKESDVALEFCKIFPELEKVVVAVKVEKKALLLRVENAAWRNELKFKEKLIVDKINNYFNESRINRIRFIS
jgi:hypothetical protein